MKKKIILSIFLLILILTGLGVYCINGDKISKNVYVQNINIGDLTKDEAKDKLSSEYKIQSFKFNYKEKTWDIDPKTLDINYDLDKTINKAYDVNRKGNIIQNIFKSLQNLAGIKTKVNLVMNCDEDKLKSELEKISKEVNKDSKDATIKIEKKKVLTSNCEEVEVSRPIKTNKIGVLSNINTKNCNVVTNQSKTKVVKELNPNKSTSVIDVKPTYVDNVIKNIDINQQIIKPKTVELMIIGPMNNYLNNEEIKDKPLRMDPTGDGFIGVVLDDGTFEPLKVSLETFTIIPNEAKNILANIESENIENKVINNINIEKDEFVNSINVAYDNSVSKYKEEYIKPLNDILKTTKTIVNNIINEDDTISVVTKQGSEYINHIKDIKHDTVSNISGIETAEVIESIDILKDYGEVVDDVKLNKDCVNAVNDIYVTEQKFASCINEKIKGNLEFVRNGIMLINDDGELTIYSTNKISSINK